MHFLKIHHIQLLDDQAWTFYVDSSEKFEAIFGICSGVKCFECPLSRNLTPSGNDGLIGISLSKEIGFPYRKKSGFSIFHLSVKVDIKEIDLNYYRKILLQMPHTDRLCHEHHKSHCQALMGLFSPHCHCLLLSSSLVILTPILSANVSSVTSSLFVQVSSFLSPPH